METASIELWHGSSHVIKHPEYGLVKPNNDYGRGFYCTRSVELAKEWACAGLDDGFANRYTVDHGRAPLPWTCPSRPTPS